MMASIGEHYYDLQNFCIGHNHQRCVQLVQTHFPPMHAMAMEQFWIPTDLCVDWCKA